MYNNIVVIDFCSLIGVCCSQVGGWSERTLEKQTVPATEKQLCRESSRSLIGELSKGEACKQYGIPRSTITTRMKDVR